MRLDRRYHFTEKYHKLRGVKVRYETVIQDVQIPVELAHEFLAFFHDKIGIKPVWICPTKPASPERYPAYDLDFGQLYMNFGFWDVVPLPAGEKDGFFNRQVELWVDRLKGRKSLYSTVFYDKESFWQHYNGRDYHALKQKYDPQGKLKDLYDKTARCQ
jgi:FAD/FMN-containing dehydrogenase